MLASSMHGEYQMEVNKVEFAPFAGTNDPFTSWKLHMHHRGDLTQEYLTRRIICNPQMNEFAFLSRPLQIATNEFQEKIRDLSPWTYHVEIEGASTRNYGSYNDSTIMFHQYRKHLIADCIVDMMGGGTVLDIGCNCGFFTLEMAHLNAKHALGIDFREENILQANLLKRAFGVHNAEFEIANIKNYVSQGRRFDIVFNLGLMYHLSTPYEIMKLCFELTNDCCVIDTITHTDPFSGYFVVSKDISIPLEGDLNFELQPTYRGILDTIKMAGFSEVIEIVAPVPKIDLYENGTRRCFVAFKSNSDIFLERLLGHKVP